ncbi:hypothetical protein TH9_12210 [Thalassospira xiamenensis]|uniref:acyl-CoA transferase n=1 Tax=Thalassospira xiamenensis TaxID=220697 RepID=UPI000DED9A31|nr:acyl-CoA transferase [Thalassospira xiamenensis]RCK32491.1 hypothetical protein TH9_12210 [Thalassospira xiamenensis]
MTTSKGEGALLALFSAVQSVAGAKVVRNEPEGADVPDGGLINVLDGDRGEPDELMSPRRFEFQHRAEIFVSIEAAESSERSSRMDELLQGICAAISADETLGGAVDLADPAPPETADQAIIGGKTVKGAILPVILYYVADTVCG